MAALEAMERARPVIATQIGGLVDQIRHGETGLLVPAGDAEALAERSSSWSATRIALPSWAGPGGVARSTVSPRSARSTGSRSSTGRCWRTVFPRARGRTRASVPDAMRSTENSRSARSRPAEPSRSPRPGS